MTPKKSKLFTPSKLGPLILKNRVIRSAAFENMGKNNSPTQALTDYHVALAKGGVAMTSVAYAAVSRSGVSFDGQIWLRKEVVAPLRTLTDAVHREGAKVSLQLAHCGNMTHISSCRQIPVGASSGFNLYSPTIVRALRPREIADITKHFASGVRLAREAGFDAVEIHAGHGYLLSQFISPYTNKRKDEFGGTLQNRMRFTEMVMQEVLHAAADDMAVIVKTNMYDGFAQGLQHDEALQVAKRLEYLGTHALVLTAGFVSKAPMVVMRGAMPLITLRHYMNIRKLWWLKLGVFLLGKKLIPSAPFREAYFLDDAKKFREQLSLPLIYVGGLTSRQKIDEVLDSGFEFVQMARALVNDTDFVRKMQQGDMHTKNSCLHSNYCVGRIYSCAVKCHHQVDELPKKIKNEIEKAEQKNFLVYDSTN